MNQKHPRHNPATFQENTTPIQEFEVEWLPLTPEVLNRPRYGRPEAKAADDGASGEQKPNVER